MKYNENSRFLSEDDVKSFVHYLVYELNVNFEPNMRFEEYVNFETMEPMFTSEQCALFDSLVDKCFDFCEAADIDFKELAQKIVIPTDFGDLGF